MNRRRRTPRAHANPRRLAALALGIPSALTAGLEALETLSAHVALGHIAELLRRELVEHAAVAVVVYATTAAAARALHSSRLANATAPLIGGCILTVAWVAEPANAHALTALPTSPTWTAAALLALNTMALNSWWLYLIPRTAPR